MKRVIFAFVLAVSLFSFVGCATHQTAAYSNYETKIIGTELDGSYTLRVAGRARNAADAYVQAGKQAVKDVLFKNIYFTNPNESPLKPLLLTPNAQQKYEDYFNAFFADGGEYKKYMSMKEKRVGSSDFSKSNADATCITTVCVYRSKLKQKLIDDGILGGN